MLISQYVLKYGGAMRDRTADLLRAKQALSQLSYSPMTLLQYLITTLRFTQEGSW